MSSKIGSTVTYKLRQSKPVSRHRHIVLFEKPKEKGEWNMMKRTDGGKKLGGALMLVVKKQKELPPAASTKSM